MSLKIATTALLLCGLALLVSWPWIVGPRPAPDAPKSEVVRYARRFVYYTGGTILVFCSTAFLAILMARRARREYREESRRNLEELLEGTLRDHGRKQP